MSYRDPWAKDRSYRWFMAGFGITPIIVATVADVAVSAGVSAATAATIGTIGAGVLEGAAGGALLGGITGGDPGMGALGGALTGGLGAGGGIVGSEIGGEAGGIAGGALGGAAGGAAGAAISGNNPVLGAGLGAVTGGVQGASIGSASPADATATGPPGSTPASVAPGAPVGGPAAPAPAAPPSLPFSNPDVSVPPDATAGAAPSAQPALASALKADQPFPPFGAGTNVDLSAPLPTATAATEPSTSGVDFALGGSGVSGAVSPTGSAIPSSESLVGTPSGGGAGTPSIGQTPGVNQAGVDSFLKTGTVPSADIAKGSGLSATPSTGGGGSSFTNFLKDPSFGNFESVVGNNIGPLASAGILGFEGLTQKPVAGANAAEPAIASAAGQLTAQGNTLQQFIQTGNLPPGLQGGINQAAESAKATIRSQYAARGMSGSSAEAQDLANVDQTAQTRGANIALNLLQQGLNETQMGTALYQSILQNSLQQDQQFSSALGNFAAALAGGGGTTLKLGGVG